MCTQCVYVHNVHNVLCKGPLYYDYHAELYTKRLFNVWEDCVSLKDCLVMWVKVVPTCVLVGVGVWLWEYQFQARYMHTIYTMPIVLYDTKQSNFAVT